MQAQRALLAAQWWGGAPPEEAPLLWRLRPGSRPAGAGPRPQAGWGAARPSPARGYLPSVTLRQHRRRRRFPLGFVGSGRGFSALLLALGSVPQSCSQQ